jgi:hypothetical protein
VPTQLTFDGQNKTQADWGQAAGDAATATLTVSRSGRGRVRSRPAGIACGLDCTATFVSRGDVTLTAIPAEGYAFVRWRGACAGTSPTCTVRIRHPRTASARFVRR